MYKKTKKAKIAMETLYQQIDTKKAKLDTFRPLPPEQIQNLDEWFKIELTYNSNAIEGNTLTRSETALVVEKGITVGGKTLREHLETTNYAIALDFIKELVSKKSNQITLANILDIHRLILKNIDDKSAGRLRNIEVKIAGSPVKLPSSIQLPNLMESFISWLTKNNDHPIKKAADAHFKLVAIHPFVDGNGRTARLLLNLLLLQDGYPPALIRKEDRLEYIDSIKKAEQQNSFDDYYRVIATSVERSLDIYLDLLQ